MARPRLTVVPDPLTEDEVISIVRTGVGYNIAELVRRGPLSRQQIKTLRKGKIKLPSRKRMTPVPADLPAPEPPAPLSEAPEPVPRRSRAPSFIGGGLITLGFIAGAVGAFINWRYSYSLGGQDPAISLACGFLGLVVDGGQQLFLPAVVPLWRQKHKILAAVAFVAWIPFLLGSTYASLGFVGVTLGDVMQARGSVPTQRTALTEQLNRLTTMRNAIKELGDQRVLENQMNVALGAVPRKNRESSKECTEPTLSAVYCYDYNILKDRHTAAKARDDSDEKIATLTERIKALPAIGAADPAAEQLAQITDGRINSTQASNYQVRWLAVVPGSSSILLTIGLALL